MKTFKEIYQWWTERINSPSTNDFKEFIGSIEVPYEISDNLNEYHSTYQVTFIPTDGLNPINLSFVNGKVTGICLGYPSDGYIEKAHPSKSTHKIERAAK